MQIGAKLNKRIPLLFNIIQFRFLFNTNLLEVFYERGYAFDIPMFIKAKGLNAKLVS